MFDYLVQLVFVQRFHSLSQPRQLELALCYHLPPKLEPVLRLGHCCHLVARLAVEWQRRVRRRQPQRSWVWLALGFLHRPLVLGLSQRLLLWSQVARSSLVAAVCLALPTRVAVKLRLRRRPRHHPDHHLGFLGLAHGALALDLVADRRRFPSSFIHCRQLTAGPLLRHRPG